MLGREEVAEFLACVSHRQHRILLTTIYATGLRISEAVVLSVPDIDSRELTIRVACGKGNKQRLVPLSPKLLEGGDLSWIFEVAHRRASTEASSVEMKCGGLALAAGRSRPFPA